MEVTRFDMLDEVMNDVKLRMLLWESVDSWGKTVEEWYHADFHTLNVEDMNLFTAKNMKNINQLEKGLPKNLVVPQLKENVETMKDKVNENYFLYLKTLTQSFSDFDSIIFVFMFQLPTISYLRNPSLRQRHWLRIENILGHKFKADEAVTLELLEKLNVFGYPNELMEVSGQASSEAALEALLKKVGIIIILF